MTLKAVFFYKILEGVKPIEYRKTTDYWKSRLLEPFTGEFREFDQIKFRNGYSSSAPVITVEWKGVDVKGGLFRIKLGKVLTTANIPSKRPLCLT